MLQLFRHALAILWTAAAALAQAIAPRGPLLVVPMPEAASWHDFAFLAALPLAAAHHGGLPLVLATDAAGQLAPEAADFVRRLRPSGLWWLGSAPATPGTNDLPSECLAADSADAAAVAIATRLPGGARAVIAPADDYPTALVAAVLAARLQAPLVFAGEAGLSPQAAAILTERRTKILLLVGDFGKTPPTLPNATSERLRQPFEVARWLSQHDLPVQYLTATTPADRTSGRVRKLSLAAAALAAGRRGALAPLGTAAASPTTAAIAQAELAQFRKLLGATPEFLCLCAMPEALPMVAVPSGAGIDSDPPSDLGYANTDGDPFAELATARFVAADGRAGILQAARCLAYELLLDPESASRYALAEWERLTAPALENVGFQAVPIHAGGKPFDSRSPLTAVAAIAHSSHSSWLQLGETAHHDSMALLAPCVVESGGCSAAALDQDPEHRSVALRLLRNGAVAFIGNARRGVAQSELFRSEFWNALLAGQTLGQANRQAWNRVQARVLARGEAAGGLYHYQLYNAACYGDPALRLHRPQAPQVAAARAELRGNLVTVHAPARWWRVEEFVVPDWKYPGPRITSWRGAGVGVHCCWDAEHHRNRDELWFTAEVRTRRKVNGLVALSPPPAPLGWDGKWSVDEHGDGSRSVYFAVRLIDFDMDAGVVLRQVERLQFRLE